MKRCPKCDQTKSLIEFARSTQKKSGYACYCKECDKEKNRRRRAKNSNRTALPIVQTKVCTRCGAIKPASDFSLCKANTDGLQAWCKICRGKVRSEYEKSNPVRVAANNARRRSMIESAGTFTAQEWNAIVKFFGQCINPSCVNVSPVATVDHVLPLSKGGSNTIDNIQPLCRPCNSAKNNRTIDYRPLDFDLSVVVGSPHVNRREPNARQSKTTHSQLPAL